MQKYIKPAVFIALLATTGFFYRGEALAHYDLATNQPKLYVYGLIDREGMARLKQAHPDIEIIERGCVAEGIEFSSDTQYNRVILQKI